MTTSNPPPQNFSMQPRGNGAAAASLVCALLGFCVPVVGGLLGIIFGIVGLQRSKETAKGGGLAMAGLIIGVISLVGWSIGGYATYKGVYLIRELSKAPRATARQFVVELSKGDADGALSDSAGISKEEIAADIAILQPAGAFQDMTSTNFNLNNNVCTLIGAATFANGTKTYTIKLVGSGTSWKVTEATFQ